MFHGRVEQKTGPQNVTYYEHGEVWMINVHPSEKEVNFQALCVRACEKWIKNFQGENGEKW